MLGAARRAAAAPPSPATQLANHARRVVAKAVEIAARTSRPSPTHAMPILPGCEADEPTARAGAEDVAMSDDGLSMVVIPGRITPTSASSSPSGSFSHPHRQRSSPSPKIARVGDEDLDDMQLFAEDFSMVFSEGGSRSSSPQHGATRAAVAGSSSGSKRGSRDEQAQQASLDLSVVGQRLTPRHMSAEESMMSSGSAATAQQQPHFDSAHHAAAVKAVSAAQDATHRAGGAPPAAPTSATFRAAVEEWKARNGMPHVSTGAGAPPHSVDNSPDASQTRVTISPLSPNPRARQRARTQSPLCAGGAATGGQGAASAAGDAIAAEGQKQQTGEGGGSSSGGGKKLQGLKLCCWQCYQLVAKEHAHRDMRPQLSGKPFCSLACADAFISTHECRCAREGCCERFIKSSGMCVAGEWYCGGLCAEKGQQLLRELEAVEHEPDDGRSLCASPLAKADMSDFSAVWAATSSPMHGGVAASSAASSAAASMC